MAELRHAARIYLTLVAASLRAQLRYKVSVLFNAGGYFVIFWSELVAIWILFEHFGTLPGWTLHEVFICYGLAHLSYALSELLVRGFEFLAFLSRSGDYDRFLLRPVDTVAQLCGYEFALHRLGRILQAVIVLVIGVAAVGTQLTPAAVLLLAWSVAGGVLLFSGLYVLQGAVGMRLLQNLEVFNILTNGGPEMAQFPMSIYPAPLRWAFTVVIPLAGVVYYPAVSFLGKAEIALPIVGWISPVGGLLFAAAALTVFRWSERRYISTGS